MNKRVSVNLAHLDRWAVFRQPFAWRPATDPEEEYTVATNDFLAAGGDGYTAFGDAVKPSKDYAVAGGVMKGENLVYSNAGRWLRDVVIDWLKQKGSIAPTVDGRIRMVP